jgi:hypothetical protein
MAVTAPVNRQRQRQRWNLLRETDHTVDTIAQ